MLYRDCVCGQEIPIGSDPHFTVESEELFQCPRCGRFLELRFERWTPEDASYWLEPVSEPPAQS